ncbi:MAG: VWA domain-containing protein [Saprospiraceae bacterium]|nr:VWA domain-containing protein [Saprospiraceae bacterium]
MKNILLIFFFSFSCVYLYGQAPKLNKVSHRALNNYIVFINEVVHASNIMHQDFETVNRQFHLYLDNKKDSIIYEKLEVLNNYDYFAYLPKDLLQNIYNDNLFLPYQKKKKPLELTLNINEIILELDSLRGELAIYTKNQYYKTDVNLEKGYKLLQRVEVLYLDLFALEEKVYWSLENILSDYQIEVHQPTHHQVIQLMAPTIKSSRALIKTLKTDDIPSNLEQKCTNLERCIQNLEQNRDQLLQQIPKIENSNFCTHRQYDQLLYKAKELLAAAKAWKQGTVPSKYTNLFHQPHHYLFNFDWLGIYNRYDNGISSIFNQYISSTKEFQLATYEIPPIFEVIQFEKEPIHNNTDPLQDTSSSLENFASNNLIFLLDVSASMDQENKLPLLKESLSDLLELMRIEDKITIITYSGRAKVVLPPTSAEHKDEIITIINSISSKNSSDVDKGLTLAYESAASSFIPNGNNRIIIATDGSFNIKGKTQKLIKKNTRNDIYLSAFYFSPKEYPHVKENLQNLVVLGGGRYCYVEKVNAQKILLQEAQSVRKKQKSN